MNNGKRFFNAVLVALSAATVIGTVDAAPQRVYVKSDGNDAHLPCVPNPCRTFAVAVGQVAVKGEVVALDTAGYGSVTITKSVSIIAPAGIYAGVSVFAGSDGITVNAPGAVVVLRGLNINGQGGRWGVYLQNAARLRIEGCVISNMAQDGINHAAAGAELVMLDTIIRDNGNFGVNVVADTSIVLDHVRSEHNQGAGLGIVPVSSEASATITDSIFSHNGGSGIVADANIGTTTYIQVDRSAMSNNGGLGFFATTAHSSAKVYAMLARNAINRNGGDGVLLSGSNPGYVKGFLSENAIQGNKGGGIVQHDQANAFAAANSVGANSSFAMSCDDAYNFISLGNNIVDSVVGSVTGCYSVSPGY